MSYHTGTELVRPPVSRFTSFDYKPDRMAVITSFNRIARVAMERVMLMLNNTEMCKKRRLTNIQDALVFLTGQHDDVGLCGDRGDFYRRQLADQIHVTFAIEGVCNNNVVPMVEAAILLEKQTQAILSNSANGRYEAPMINIDEDILNILARIADVF